MLGTKHEARTQKMLLAGRGPRGPQGHTCVCVAGLQDSLTAGSPGCRIGPFQHCGVDSAVGPSHPPPPGPGLVRDQLLKEKESRPPSRGNPDKENPSHVTFHSHAQ